MSQDKMTPHDELMALAGKATPGEWEAGGDSDPTAILAREGWAQVSMTNDALPEAGDNAAFIAAACNFVRSDAFRAMVRNDARYRWLRDKGMAHDWTVSRHPTTGSGVYQQTPASLDAAIDAAASGEGE